ncbi:ABC transporter substrate-binding protein [Marivita sp. GX14005]|uniref:heme/hemin ABC transporter substrate-binding protein n=1 Tax=Marivita sp. GX14005 TaxID=2942276 RepID=UPI00201932E2|nr:ABC transporter substrate-binding protein [Marivita sp. GX14005]MCL3883378.1 ABC transporter substrate-binding protein [Marivita sp. GX14005]
MFGAGPRTGLAALLAAALSCSAAAETSEPDVVSIGGSITEIVYALGQEHRLVARDTTSNYPEAAQALPDVGYVRALSPEGVLSVDPGLVLAEADAGPPEALDVLKAAWVPLTLIPDAPTGEGITEKILAVGKALGVQSQARALAGEVEAKLARAAARAERVADEDRKRVLFVLSAQGGRLLAAGRGTEAAAVIEMAGAVNALKTFEGYKPVGDEAVIAAAPDVILMMTRGGQVMIEYDALFALPAIAATPAGRTRAVIRMGGQYLLGFGPRTPEAVHDLADALYGVEPDDAGNL